MTVSMIRGVKRMQGIFDRARRGASFRFWLCRHSRGESLLLLQLDWSPPLQLRRKLPKHSSAHTMILFLRAITEGNRTTPSYVAFTDSERLIGDSAKNQAAMNPRQTGEWTFVAWKTSLLSQQLHCSCN